MRSNFIYRTQYVFLKGNNENTHGVNMRNYDTHCVYEVRASLGIPSVKKTGPFLFLFSAHRKKKVPVLDQ